MIYGAYGSNLNVEQMMWRCPGAEMVGTASLKGYRLSFKGSKTGSYLTIEEADGYSVPIGLWKIDRSHERRLDTYEGYPKFYRKVFFKAKNGFKVMVYIMNDGRPYGLPSREYLATCLIGYDDFGFDKGALIEAVTYTAGKENENVS